MKKSDSATLELKTVFRIVGLDINDIWRPIEMFNEEGKSVNPFNSKMEAIQRTKELKEQLLESHWVDVAVEAETTFVRRIF